MPPRKRSVVTLTTAERRAKLIELRALGKTWQQCADQLGYSSRGHACADYGAAIDEVKDRMALSLDQYRTVQLENYLAVREVACRVMNTLHPFVQGGKIVTTGGSGPDDPERPLYDDGPTLAAIDRISKIDGQIAALLGLNAPTRVEAEGSLTVTVVGVDPAELT